MTMPSLERETCEWCGEVPAAEEHHVAQGSGHRQASDPYPELKLNLCSECHRDLHEQKAKREIGLALLVLAGRGSLRRIVSLFWTVTKRRYPEERKVKKWVKRLERSLAA